MMNFKSVLLKRPSNLIINQRTSSLRAMKNRPILGLSMSLAGLLSICWSAESAEPKDIIRDKSPDGKFALRLTKEDVGWGAAIIDLKTKSDVVGLEIYQNQGDAFIKQGHLVWSKDSQRVAYFVPDRRGGSTTVYFRNGSKFEDVELPELPECKNPPGNKELHHVKTIESTTKPQKWLGSGALELNVRSGDLMENETDTEQTVQTCSQDVTIAFDSSHQASVQSVKQVKSE